MIRKILILVAGVLIALTASTSPARAAPPPAANGEANYSYQQQLNFYYCAPAATRLALTAAGLDASQDALASRLHTTVYGTDSAHETTRVMNEIIGKWYRTQTVPAKATSVDEARLKSDVQKTLSTKHIIVANIAGTASDTQGRVHSYPGGHYLNAVAIGGDIVAIADVASPSTPRYEMTINSLTQWLATRGYSTV